MKRLVFIVLLFGFAASAQDSALSIEKDKISGKLSVSMLRDLKASLSQNFGKNIDSLKTVTIFYYQPKANCSEDAYKFIKPDKPQPKEAKWVKSDVLYLCYEKGIPSQYIKLDEGAVVYNAFFSENRGCEGMVTVNAEGRYLLIKKRGSHSIANKFIEELALKR